MQKLLKVTAIGDMKTNSSGLNYYQVWFSPLTILESGQQIFSNQQERHRVVFDAHDEFKGDSLFREIKNREIKVGSLVEGTVSRFDVYPYQPEGYTNPVTSYTCVVFSNENGITYANRQLKANYSCVIDPLTGTATNEAQLVKPFMAQSASNVLA